MKKALRLEGGSISVSDHFWLCGQTEDYDVRGGGRRKKKNTRNYTLTILHCHVLSVILWHGSGRRGKKRGETDTEDTLRAAGADFAERITATKP